MRRYRAIFGLGALLSLYVSGCKTTAPTDVTVQTPVESALSTPAVTPTNFVEPADDVVDSTDPVDDLPQAATVQNGEGQLVENGEDSLTTPDGELLPLPAPEQMIEPSLLEVVESVRNHFPLIVQAAAARRIAAGQAISASGAFDHKLDVFSESQPLDFYENSRHSIGIKRETTWGGQTFAGYRIGRGSFEPWYLERETNAGGEFKAGFVAPIIRDRWIDANRATLWQAQLERRRVEPEILAEIIRYVREGSVIYWQWIAAGANRDVMTSLLDLAEQRNEGLIAQVEVEEKAEIDLVDNRRIIVSRESKLIDAERKLRQATVKLSLYYRMFNGEPNLIDLSQVPRDYFTRMLYGLDPADLQLVVEDEQVALAQRPELRELQIIRQQLNVALRQAKNETWPDVDGGLLMAQDVGEPTSSKRDKSEFEVEALLTVSVPLERRKAFGKIRSLRGKLAQLTSKNQFAAEKITAEVRIARAALEAAQGRVARATESFELAQQMQEAEQELFNQGQSTLFNLNIREKQSAEAAAARIEAQLEYQIARANYAAALGTPGPEF